MSKSVALPALSVIFACALILAVGEVGFRAYARYLFSYQDPGEIVDLTKEEITSSSPHGGIGWELRPNVDATFRGQPFSTNSQGLRSVEHPLKKPAKTYRIVGIGDSVLMGWGVAQGEDFLSLVERELRRRCEPPVEVETINFGVLGYNAIQEYFVLKDKALAYDPDLILLQYAGNDQDLTDFEEPKVRFSTRSLFLNFVVLRTLRLLGQVGPDEIYDWRYDGFDKSWAPKDFVEAIEAIFRLANEREIPVIMVLDSRYEWSPGLLHAEVVEIGRRFGVDSIDLFAIHRDLPERTPVRKAIAVRDEHNLEYLFELGHARDTHPNARWHAMTAGFVRDRILERKLVPGCGS